MNDAKPHPRRWLRRVGCLLSPLILLVVLAGTFVLYRDTMINNYHASMKSLFLEHPTLFTDEVGQTAETADDQQNLDPQLQEIGIDGVDRFYSPAVIFWAKKEIPLIISSLPGGLVFTTDVESLPDWLDIQPVANHWYSFREMP